jgi:hypothetical protein
MALSGFSQKEQNPTGNFVTVSNLASGGAIGTATATVDQYLGAMIAQTTASQTITLPAPTGNTPKVFFVTNTGSVAFTMLQKTVYPGTSLTCIFSGVSIPNQGYIWSATGASATLTTTTSTTV